MEWLVSELIRDIRLREMNLRILCKLIGVLLIFLAAGQFVCLACSIGYSEGAAKGWNATKAFFWSFWISLVCSAVLLALGRGSGNDLLQRESISAVGLGWIFCTLCGAIPYWLCEPQMSWIDGLFESVSGFTATGATVIEDVEGLPKSLLLWRALTQWFGGLGILVLFVALLSSAGAGSKALFQHESSAFETEGPSPRIRPNSFELWIVYVVFSLVCFCGLWISRKMDVFDAVCHTFTTVATGGFSTYNDSIAHFESAFVEYWIICFMVLGSLNFLLYPWLWPHRWRQGKTKWRQDESTKVFVLILCVAALSIFVVNCVRGSGSDTWRDNLRPALFQVVSILTTTGFTTDNYDKWPDSSVMLLVMLMIIGGCAGSTSGGLKVGRLVLFFKILCYQLRMFFRPNLVMTIKLNGNLVTESFRMATLFLMSMVAVSLLVGTAAVSFLEPQLNIRSCFSATLATLCNIGPALGEAGPEKTYAGFHGPAKLLLSFLMLLGRLEFSVLLVLFMPSLWKRY